MVLLRNSAAAGSLHHDHHGITLQLFPKGPEVGLHASTGERLTFCIIYNFCFPAAGRQPAGSRPAPAGTGRHRPAPAPAGNRHRPATRTGRQPAPSGRQRAGQRPATGRQPAGNRTASGRPPAGTLSACNAAHPLWKQAILYLVDGFGLKHLQVTCNLVVKYLQPSVSQAKSAKFLSYFTLVVSIY